MLEDFATVAVVMDRLRHTASWDGPQIREDGKMRVVQTRACTNRIHGSWAVTYKLCTLECGKKAPRCAAISPFSFIKGADEEAVRGELEWSLRCITGSRRNSPAGIYIRSLADFLEQHLNKAETHI